MNKALVCLIMLGILVGAVPAAQSERLYLVMPHRGVEVSDSDEPGPMKAIADAIQESVNTATNTFNITYQDPSGTGFNDATKPERKQRLQDALNYISNVIQMPGTLDILVAPSEFDGAGAVAFAGTYFTYSVEGFSPGFTFRRLSSGNKPNPAYPEIQVTVDFGHSAYTGTGQPGATQIDLLSVLVHELTHGLGFASLVASTGYTNAEDTSAEKQAYTVFDSLVWRKDPTVQLFSGAPVVFHGTVNDLISAKLVFHGTNAAAYYGFGAPGLYSPSPFEPGSSIQHWYTNQVIGGAVMEHQFVPGETKRRYAAVDIGALIDLGYVNAAQTPEEGEGEGITEGEGTAEGEGQPEGVAEGEGEGQELPAHLTVTPNPTGGYSFGDIEVGSVVEQTFQVTNTGGGSLTGGVTLTGNGFVLLGAISYILAPGDTPAQIRVRFAPLYTGGFTGLLRLTGGENGPVTITVRGTGIETAQEGQAEGEGEGETPPPQDCSCSKNGQGLPDASQLFVGMLSILVLLTASQFYRFRG